MGMTSTGTNFEPTYFARQATKSDAKLRWQYDRMIGFAGVRLYSSSRVLDIGCGAAPGLRYLQSRGSFAVGCDVSTAALVAARAALPSASPPPGPSGPTRRSHSVHIDAELFAD